MLRRCGTIYAANLGLFALLWVEVAVLARFAAGQSVAGRIGLDSVGTFSTGDIGLLLTFNYSAGLLDILPLYILLFHGFAATLSLIGFPRTLLTLSVCLYAKLVTVENAKIGLHPLRLLNILARAWLAFRLAPHCGKWLASPLAKPLVLCGRQSLPLYCAGAVLAPLGGVWLSEVPGPAGQGICNMAGVLIMVSVAALAAARTARLRGIAPNPGADAAAPDGAVPNRSGMRTPRRGVQQLHLLRHHQRPKPSGETLYEIHIGKHRRPMRPAIRVVVELPHVDKLVDRAGIALKIPHQLLVVATLLQRRKAEFLIQFHRLAHLADIKRVSPQLV
jgi:hypothetical protein